MNEFIQKHGRTILNISSIAGVVGTAITSVIATKKSINQVDKNKQKTKIDVVKKVWKNYIPVVLTGIGTIACILGADHLSKKTQASLIGVYTLLHKNFQEYKNANKELHGSNVHEKIQAHIAKTKTVGESGTGISLYSPDNQEKNGDTILFYDSISSRYFDATPAALINAQYHVNRNLELRGYVTLNEYYEFIGIPGIKDGDIIGWDLNELIEGGVAWLDFDNTDVDIDDDLKCYITGALLDPIVLPLR